MKSPFPGMDPYLERYWRDVHGTLVTLARIALNEQLPAGLAARTEDRVYVESTGAPTRVIAPDVRIVEKAGISGAAGESATAVAQPLLLELDTDPTVEHFVEIIDSEGGKVITAIEFLSPTNKVPGEGREAYLKKRREFLASETHLVEIDLVRAGNWMELVWPYRIPPEYRSMYRVIIRRAGREKAELYRISLRQRLPRIPIPLRAGDRDAVLDLQGLLDRTYESGRYDSIDYSKLCDPPLEGEDARWLEEKVRER